MARWQRRDRRLTGRTYGGNMKQASDRALPIDHQQIAVYADAAAAMVGMPIPDQCRAGVIANLSLIFNQTAALMALDLRSEDEAAPVFRP